MISKWPLQGEPERLGVVEEGKGERVTGADGIETGERPPSNGVLEVLGKLGDESITAPAQQGKGVLEMLGKLVDGEEVIFVESVVAQAPASHMATAWKWV